MSSGTRLVQRSLPVGAVDTLSLGWWGVLTVVATEGALLIYLLFSYFYITIQTFGNMAPPSRPPLHYALPMTGVLILNLITMWWAELLANQLGATVKYTWWAQRRGYVRNTLRARKCDIWPGIASGYERAETTRPYYRSSYVFVTRRDRHLEIHSFDNPRLHTLVIGVQMVGDDGTNTPPTYSLARRGIVNNVRGYWLFDDYAHPNPARSIVDAVENGDVDVAVVWGPLAGYFAALEPKPLTITPVEPQFDTPGLPMAFNIAMGVQRGNTALKDQIDQLLEQDQAAIDTILTEYHVPWTPPTETVSAGPNPFLVRRFAPALLHKPEQQ